MITINHFSVEEELKYRSYDQHGVKKTPIKMLGVKGEAAVVLLQTALDKQRDKCRYDKYWDRYFGGGLFVQTRTEAFINTSGEVGLFFTENAPGWRKSGDNTIKKFIRSTRNEAELMKAIKDKLANTLKNMWKDYSKYLETHDGLTIEAKIKDEVKDFVYSENDYRVLYEVLKGRNIDKLQAKYSKETFTKMIGIQIEDQFIVSATELIKAEIAKLISQRENALKELGENSSSCSY